MKHFIYILSVFFVLAVTGCNDDDDDIALSVISAEIDVSAAGGGGTILVSAPGSVTAESSANWCTASVSGNTITVTASTNSDFSGRTALVTIKSLGQEVYVPLTQPGVVFSVEVLSFVLDWNEGSSIRVPFVNSLPVTAATDAVWLGCVVDNNALILTALSDNDSFMQSRAATVAMTCNGILCELTVKQHHQAYPYADIPGGWTMTYTDWSDEQEYSLPVTITENVVGESFTLSNGPMGDSFELLYENGNLVLSNMQYIGRYSTYYIYISLLDTDQGYYTAAASAQYEAELSLNDNVLTYTFADNGSWPDYKVTGYMYGAFSSSMVYGGSLLYLENVTLTRIIP